MKNCCYLGGSPKCPSFPRKAVYGKVELDNGIILNWLRFAVSEEEAVRIVTAQHVHVRRCWAEVRI